MESTTVRTKTTSTTISTSSTKPTIILSKPTTGLSPSLGSTRGKKDKIRENRGESNGVFTDVMQNELRLKRESQQEKDRIVIKFEELRFLVARTDRLSSQDAAIIEMQKDLIWAKYLLP
ncbi:hypothetical protein Tco_0153198 [Tanacetum coccineum]